MTTRWASWTAGSFSLPSVQFVGLILPSNSHAEIWTRLCNFFRYLAIGMCHFRYLWNGLCDRHRAEITVMQFTGHSLPVHQSMSVPWEFFSLSHFISQFPPMRFPLITAIRMCHLLPVHHLGMAFLAGSKGQNITHVLKIKICDPFKFLFLFWLLDFWPWYSPDFFW